MSDEDPFGDETIAAVLARVVWVVNPVLDVLSSVDPLGLKERTKNPHEETSLPDVVDGALNVLAWALNTADVPGTKAWDEMDLDARSRWWVRRVGALNTLLVAYPGVFGAIVDRLPIQATLAYGNQAILLVAVARVYGLTDQHDQVRMLAQVLNKRLIPDEALLREVDHEDVETEQSWTPFALAKTLWRISKMVRGIGGELGKRPQPDKIFRYLSVLPFVGAVADYFGEYAALERAAEDGQRWVIANSPIVKQ